MRQLLTESVLLALIGGSMGVALSLWSTRALAAFAEKTLPGVQQIGIDGTVLAFSVLVSLLTGILFGLAPSLQTSRADLNTGLRDESRGSTGGKGRNRLRSALVVSQVALAVILLIGSGLLIRSFLRLVNVSPGLDSSNLLTMTIALPPVRYTANDKMVQFFDEVVARARRLPGVRSASAASALPLNPSRFSPALLEGQPPVPLPQRPLMNLQMVEPGYFATMGIPLLSGRAFDTHDDAHAQQVAIVNQTLARRYWPNDTPIGKKIYLGRLTTPLIVIGVAGDVKNVTLAGETSPEIDMPFAQRPWRMMHLIMRTASDPQLLASAARREVASVDADQPVTEIRSMDEVLAASRTQPRLMMTLLGLFAGTALLLAVVGIYGALSYLVAQRTQELGIRMALGAGRHDILGMVIRQGMAITGVGVAIGVALSFAFTRLLARLLFQVSETDPWTYAGAALVFAAVALLASYVPARRATRIDPTLAMRSG